QTIIGQLVGTVQYMSPEQCDADPDDLDTRSDVYSLGVVLYELLTGVLPYDASNTTIYAATRAIKEQTPRRPSSINHRLRGDVETIALKALEKTRERRYQSAADVAHDIRRYLNREPITARPPTAWTRTVHWVARHPILTTTVACLGIAVFVAAGTYVSVRLVNARPYVIVHNAPFDHRRSEQGCETRLRALSGRDLRIWTREDGVRTARLRERPGEFGGGELLLLGFNNSQSSPFPGFLCAFDVHGGLENPVWKRRVETRDILRDLRSFRGATTDDFAVHYAAYVDVFPEDKFPEQPGEEVVVWFKRSWYSQTVLRIYDLRGELLYQVWHDGVVHSIYWMSDAGLLVLAGDCHWPYHDPFGTLLSKRVHDFVVFAVRPEPGFVADDYLDYLSLKPGDDRLDPPWYLRLRPDDALKIVEWTDFSPPRRPNDPGRSVAFYVGMHGERNSLVSWVIGDDGQEVAQSRVLSDAYRKNQRLDDDDSEKLILPDPDDFALVPFQLTDLAPGNAYGLSGKKRDRP
ncbi:MAG: serine/threonine protein kinase, partial [Phycisphaerae bacterium]